jgi:hypothetical protein
MVGGEGFGDMREDEVNELLESRVQEPTNEDRKVLMAAEEEQPAMSMLRAKAAPISFARQTR